MVPTYFDLCFSLDKRDFNESHFQASLLQGIGNELIFFSFIHTEWIKVCRSSTSWKWFFDGDEQTFKTGFSYDNLPPPTKNICFKILHFFTNNFFDHYNFLLISFQPCIDSVPMLTTLRKAGSMFPERC